MDKNPEQISEVLHVIDEASQAVLEIYNSEDIRIEMKADSTPVTQADIAAHDIILSGLSKLGSIPIISEEGDKDSNQQLLANDEFWLVDPIDGTGEFIKHSGHFVVCAGLIKGNEPQFGVVSVPAHGVTFYGGPQLGAFKITQGEGAQPISVKKNNPGVVLHSRSNLNQATDDYISVRYPSYDRSPVGSPQYKLATIAEGKADVYPLVGGTLSLWDLAAGHAILTAAGGTVVKPDGQNIDYQSRDLLTGNFIASN